MFGPTGLTHFVYVCLAIVALGVIAYAVYYNLKMKSRDKELGLPGGATNDTPSKILAEKHADDQHRGH